MLVCLAFRTGSDLVERLLVGLFCEKTFCHAKDIKQIFGVVRTIVPNLGWQSRFGSGAHLAPYNNCFTLEVLLFREGSYGRRFASLPYSMQFGVLFVLSTSIQGNKILLKGAGETFLW